METIKTNSESVNVTGTIKTGNNSINLKKLETKKGYDNVYDMIRNSDFFRDFYSDRYPVEVFNQIAIDEVESALNIDLDSLR